MPVFKHFSFSNTYSHSKLSAGALNYNDYFELECTDIVEKILLINDMNHKVCKHIGASKYFSNYNNNT